MSLVNNSFAIFLKNIVASGQFNTVHEKLSLLLAENFRNSCEQNAMVCCEIITEHARLKQQLFRLLELSAEDSHSIQYGASESMNSCFFQGLSSGDAASNYTTLVGTAATDVKEIYQSQTQKLEDPKSTYDKTTQLHLMLNNARIEIKAIETELNQWRKITQELRKENCNLHGRLQKQILEEFTDSELTKHTTDHRWNTEDHLHNCAIKLVEKFSDIYKCERRELMESLNGFADQDTNEKLVFSVVKECFTVCRSEQKKAKNRVHNALLPNNENCKEKIVTSYMKSYQVIDDIELFIQDVIRGLHRNREITSTMPSNEKVLVPFIREVLRISWSMLALNPPIDIAIETDGEVINETLYQRHCSSEFSSFGIHHYVWPALMLSGRVIKKGEVVTRRLDVREKPKPYLASSPNVRRSEIQCNLSPSFDLGFSSMSSSPNIYSSFKSSSTF